MLLTKPKLLVGVIFMVVLLACSGSNGLALEAPVQAASAPAEETTQSAEENEQPANSVIFGRVLDLSTDQPGADIQVSINEGIIHTDAQGNYSITGLSAGEYLIQPKLDGQGLQAHDPVWVKLDGQSQADVRLAYYSQPQAAPINELELQPLPTDTSQPQAIAAASPPERLPEAGASLQHRPWLLMGAGLLLVIIGIWSVDGIRQPA